MASDYENKFEEMKKYIPFLESMISRLETFNSGDNPRQAQLNKIRALRDLLLEKNKRMKMENLNKCEQVLKNLYAKVEQSDSLTKNVPPPPPVISEKIENAAGKSLKLHDSPILKPHLRSVCNVVQHNPEGVLFHRRPRKDTISPIPSPSNKDHQRKFDEVSLARRNYTRVLVSPDTSRVLYHRRSPKTPSRSPIKSPNKKSPSYKRIKKSSKHRSRSRKPKDINITINVPDKSLNSLNGEDFIERIKKCDDSDVDLDVLQGIRKQLFHELKQTGINADITDFILNSYGNRKKKKKKEKEKEYEEGELSDSESEYIEKVYDNIVTDFQSEEFSKGKIFKTSSKMEVDRDTAVRKIKINFTLAGSNVHNDFPENIIKEHTETITSDPMIDAETSEFKDVVIPNAHNINTNVDVFGLSSKEEEIMPSQNLKFPNKSEDDSKDVTIANDQTDVSKNSIVFNFNEGSVIDTQIQTYSGKNNNISQDPNEIDVKNNGKEDLPNTHRENKANFYKPLSGPVEYIVSNGIINSDKKLNSCNNDVNSREKCETVSKAEDVNSSTKSESPGGNSIEIPFISNTSKIGESKRSDEEIISHIDILAALKKDIMSESLDISNKSNEIPALHQPKLIKVTGTTPTAFEIDRKKRISLEKYKEKINPVPKLFLKEALDGVMREDKIKKQSRGLTAKECERFNFRNDILRNESWDDCDKDDDSEVAAECDEGFAPKSPEQNSFDVLNQIKEPIIIPTESSANNMIDNAYFDTDMRVLDRGLNRTTNNNVPVDVEVAAEVSDVTTKLAKHSMNNTSKCTLSDPRIKNDNFNVSAIPLLNLSESKSHKFNNESNLVQTLSENDSLLSSSNREMLREVFAKTCGPLSPVSPMWETVTSSEKDFNAEINAKGNFLNLSNEDRDPRSSSGLLDDAKFIQDQRNQRLRNDRDPRLNSDRRSECPRTPSHYFGKSDYPQTPTHPFGRTDCPMTPVHPFGRSECPSTPLHSFGRSEGPPIPARPYPFKEINKSSFCLMDISSKLIPSDTSYFGVPSHPFGASEMPGTPHHPFGASEIPGTPHHPFGASEIPGTPHHPFGASEIPGTPRHPFGTAEIPATPRHPFEPAEMLDTPRHPFGPLEIPGTPRHSFGYPEMPPSPFVSFGAEMANNSSRSFLPSEAPRTPVNQFGSSEIPRTPVHPFGRTDYLSYNSDCQPTPNHSFGRPSANYSNESRQNRHADYNLSPVGNGSNPRRCRPQNVNRSLSDYNNEVENQPNYSTELSIGRNDFGRDHKYDRSRSQSQFRETSVPRRENTIDFQRNLEVERGRSQQRQFREVSTSRREDITNFQRDHRRERGRSQQKQFKETIVSNREHSVGRSNSRDCSRDRSYGTEFRITKNFNSESFEAKRMKDRVSQNQRRAASVGRSCSLNENICTEESVMENRFGSLNTRNTLDVESHAGRSFTIDTSVNRTFQVISKPAEGFNDRRRRASSVGRSLNSTSSSDSYSFSHKQNEQFIIDKRNNFRRARSMGRDCESSYKINDLEKNDFKHYKPGFENRGRLQEEDNHNRINTEMRKTSSKDIKYDRSSNMDFNKKHDTRIKDFPPDNQRDVRKNYESDHKLSPTRYSNSRDPRLQKLQFQKHGSRIESNKYRRFNEDRNITRKCGITYTNEKISSGTVIGPGSGVKNYKIPKLKRVISDSEKNDSDDSTISRNKHVTESSKSKSVKSGNLEKITSDPDSNDKNESDRQQNKEKQNRSPVQKECKHNVDLNDSLISHNRKTRVRKLSSDSEFEESMCENQIDNKEQKNPSNSDITKSVQTQSTTDGTLETKEDVFTKSVSSSTNATAQQEYDMELFTDFTVSESAPSTEINQLIANLDKDLDICNNPEVVKVSTDNLLQSTGQTDTNVPIEQSSSSKLSQSSSQTDPLFDARNKRDCAVGEVELSSVNNTLKEKNPHAVEYFEKVSDKVDCSEEIQSGKQNVEKISDTLEQSPIVSSPQKDKCQISTQIDGDENSVALNDKIVGKNIVEIKAKETTPNNSVIEKNILEKEIDDNIPLVSTSILENQPTDDGEKQIDALTSPSQSEVTFIADSTVNTVEGVVTSQDKSNDILPDSTNENNADVECNDKTSDESHTHFLKAGNEDLEAIQSTSNIASMSNLLTILQGKSKIKELLSMLTDDGSLKVEKIRRKLEKLSEIVSDEEDNESVSIGCDNEPMSQTQMNNEDADTPRTDKDLPVVKDISTESLPSKTTFKKVHKRKIRRKIGKMKSKSQVAKPVEKAKRTTRSVTAAEDQTKRSNIKKPANRELMMLQEDIREMFISTDVLNATGIRMCRIAKLVDENVATRKKGDSEDTARNKSRTRKSNDLNEVIAKDLESNPLVVLEKVTDNIEEMTVKPTLLKHIRKKPGPKPKSKVPVCDVPTDSNNIEKPETKSIKYKPGPLSKTRHLHQNVKDSEETEFKSLSEMSESNLPSSESECETLASLKKECSTGNIKNTSAKMKRRRNWKAGVSKSMKKKKMVITQVKDSYSEEAKQPDANSSITLPEHIFTDKAYCFYKNQTNYACRYCDFVGSNIVHHYKCKHPHDEIPISRINPIIASEAIKQSLDINLEAFIKIPNKKHVCRFCFETFSKGVSNSECFFWHIISIHTGEYEQPCTVCTDASSCSTTMTKPNPPDKTDGLLLGYICGECNYTQVSLDNLKHHVNKRHDDPNIKVYQISLGDITQKMLSLLAKSGKNASDTSLKTGRSLRSNTKIDVFDDKSDITETSDQISESDNSYLSDTVSRPPFKYKPGPASKKKQTVIRFEYEDTASENSEIKAMEGIRVEVKEENELDDVKSSDCSLNESFYTPMTKNAKGPLETFVEPSVKITTHDDKREENLFYGAHFMTSVSASGVKEYICCVNGVQNHYKTTLKISLKKHVQMKHKESWDGYCCVCKVIVTSLGVHNFQDCLAHFLQNHMDDFPTLKDNSSDLKESVEESHTEKHAETPVEALVATVRQREFEIPTSAVEVSKKYINVRPLSDLQHQSICEFANQSDSEPGLIRIESVVSLNPSETRKSETTFTSETRGDPALVRITSQSPIHHYATRSDTVGPRGEWTPSSVTENKHRVVLDTMLDQSKLVQIFKCAGKFCSFSCDSAELAVLHATTHQRTGGVGALRCVYCTFEALASGIDLVAHVFREHGHCQYACQKCFYRATSALLVEEHVRCSHPEQARSPIVLRAPLATPAPSADTGLVLSRADAVPEYICTYGRKQCGPDQCKFRTYTLGKFMEHYKQRHPGVTSYECSECGTALEVSSEASAAAALAQHQRDHGVCQYHCTYCVFGADTERELIAHAAHAHPARRPQAYLRHIVESKGPDGNPKLKVLPLVHFNKGSCDSVLDVEATSVADDPVKEAARALDLEKLLGHTALMIEQAMTVSTSQPAAPPCPISESPRTEQVYPGTSISAQNDPNILKTACPTPLYDADLQDRVQITLMDAEAKSKTSSAPPAVPALAKIKTEPQDVPAVISLTSSSSTAVAMMSTPPVGAADVISLNSDEENERGTSEVINISDNDDSPSAGVPVESSNRLPLASVYKCAKCRVIFKTGGGFKRHLSTCCPRPPLSCAYCAFRSDDRALLADHMMRDHGPTSQYSCFYCRYITSEMQVIDRHVSTAHGIKNPAYSQDLTVKLFKKFIVRGVKSTTKAKPDKPAVYAGAPPAVVPTTATRRRYGPADIDALPIAPIVDEPILCAECDFDTKVRVNMVRHLQLHAQRQPAPRTAPVNPVPYLETNEKHFDKMTNLAASSNAVRVEKSSTKDSTLAPPVSVRYPQFVPERSRHACGAPDCSYISVDEAMLRRHWEALHSTCSVFRCVHCPPDQQLDPTLPLTSARIISHLRMHDSRLFGCSGCNIYYHYQQQAVEKHISEKHPFGASVITLRQPAQATPTIPPVPASVTSSHTPTSTPAVSSSDSNAVSAPTMDLKPWQCGLCEFKSMLRPEVVEHCGRVHNSKMQYKCAICSWRGALYECASKHCATAHPGRSAEVLHLYYREGSVPPGPDGSPRWLHQSLLSRANDRPAQPATEVKLAPIVSPVDLNLVKNELLEETENHDERFESAQSLMERYEKFCEPRAGKFVCPKCNLTEDSKDAMTAHLYEELNYRKWSCSVCSYKAFTKVRLMEHALQEHCQTQEPTALPADQRLETWVKACVAHQERLMRPQAGAADKYLLPNEACTPATASASTPGSLTRAIFDAKQLEDAFGAFGAPRDCLFSCPKCIFTVEEEEKFKDHLEYELAKVRWCCSLCPEKFHRYHEAQLHCKSAHSNAQARAIEASRDPEKRAAWVAAVVRIQSLSCALTPTGDQSQTRPNTEAEGVDNSLLVVRYEEQAAAPTTPAPASRAVRKRRPLSLAEPDSDDERLVIDEYAGAPSGPSPAAADATAAGATSVLHPNAELPHAAVASSSSLPEKCHFCGFAGKTGMLEHLAKHYNVKPYVCAYCGFNGIRSALYKHQLKEHAKQPRRVLPVKLPPDPVQQDLLREAVPQRRRFTTVLCLLCGARVLKTNASRHAADAHPGQEPQLVDPKAVVVRCQLCGALRQDHAAMTRHRNTAHPGDSAFQCIDFKLPRPKNAVLVCEHCARRFKYKCDFYAHHDAAHPGLEMRFTAVGDYPVSGDGAPAAASATAQPTFSETVSRDDDADAVPGGLDDAFSAGVMPTIMAVTSLASDGAKRKLPDEFDECVTAAPPRRVAKKSTARPSSLARAADRPRAVARKSTTPLPLYYVESDSESDGESVVRVEAGQSWYGTQPRPLAEYAHVTAVMPVPVLNTLMSFTLDRLSELTNISPRVLVKDVRRQT